MIWVETKTERTTVGGVDFFDIIQKVQDVVFTLKTVLTSRLQAYPK